MLKTYIVMTAYKRTAYLRQTLDSWNNVRGIEDVDLCVHLEPSPVQDAMMMAIESFNHIISYCINPALYGVLVNPWEALNSVLGRDDVEDSTFCILAEEDVIVSTDILEYFNHVRESYTYNDVLGVCAFSDLSVGKPDQVYTTEYFTPLVWGTWAYNWKTYLRDTWDKDYSTNNGTPGQESGWDWNINRLVRQWRLPFVHPEVSRSKHIGELDGVHTTPETFAALSCDTFELKREPVTWR